MVSEGDQPCAEYLRRRLLVYIAHVKDAPVTRADQRRGCTLGTYRTTPAPLPPAGTAGPLRRPDLQQAADEEWVR